MFGFLKGNSGDRRYRSLYARACQCHFSENGRLAAIFHSYEAVFLFSLASDLGLIRQPAIDDVTCCRLRKRFEQDGHEAAIGKFCSAFAMLLVRIKLEDDWIDDRKLLSKLALKFFARPIRHSTNYFRSLDRNFDSTISQILGAQQKLERSRSPVSLEQAEEQTRSGFAYMFRLFAEKFLSESQQSDFALIGSELGGAIIAFDCAADWKSDKQRQRFNPLRESSEIHQGYLECARCLSRANWLIHKLAPENHLDQLDSVNVLRKWIRHSLRLTAKRKENELPIVIPTASLPFRALSVKKNLRRGECDCFCGDCSCDGCPGDAAADVPCSFCDCGMCCDCPCGNSNSKKSNAEETSTQTNENLIGSKGITCGFLNPAGLVTIENNNHPAISDSGTFIEAGIEIEVVSVSGFGLRVRPVG